jgi:geranylgeranyl reductase family protein
MTTPEREVLVVGGGPAGAATATFLKQLGHDVLLLDAARFPRDKVCGESVSPEAWRLLCASGAAPRVRGLGPQPIRGMALTAPDGTGFCGLYGDEREPGFAVRRDRLDAALLDAARDSGVEVREGARVTGVLVEPRGVCGVTWTGGGDPEPLRARLVVAADGRRSVVARSLDMLTEEPRLRRFAVRGHWDGMDGLAEHGEMHVGDGAYCGVAPLSRSAANVAFVLDRRNMHAAAGDLEGFYRQVIGERWPQLAERLARARLRQTPRAIGPLALRARRAVARGLVLVGDAAGFYDPFTGEGITLALRSAELAAEAAAAWLRGRRPLGDYDRRRREATRDKFRFNRLLQRIICWPDLANAVARRLARRPDLADRLIGIAGDFVPARAGLSLSFAWDLLRS